VLNGKKVISIIPARSGSLGVPGKNYKIICKRPLLWWSIEAAERSKYIDTIVVSSNCKECLNIATSSPYYTNWSENHVEGHDIPFKLYTVQRPDEISGPSSTTEEAMINAVKEMKNNHNMEFGYVVLLQPTSPCRNNNLIDKCLEKMIDNNADSVLTVSRHTPFFWQIDENGKAYSNYSNTKRPMRQDILETDFLFHDCGNMYAVEEELLNNFGRYGRNPVIYETDSFQSMQIDTEEDFIIMENMAKIKQGFLT